LDCAQEATEEGIYQDKKAGSGVFMTL